jgi:hypothetical protein
VKPTRICPALQPRKECFSEFEISSLTINPHGIASARLSTASDESNSILIEDESAAQELSKSFASARRYDEKSILREIARQIKLLVDQSHLLNPVLPIGKHILRHRILHLISLHVQQAADHLEIIFDAMMNFVQLTSFSCSVRRIFFFAIFRSVTSRIVVETRTPSFVSSGQRLISTGNSMPSLRRP